MRAIARGLAKMKGTLKALSVTVVLLSSPGGELRSLKNLDGLSRSDSPAVLFALTFLLALKFSLSKTVRVVEAIENSSLNLLLSRRLDSFAPSMTTLCCRAIEIGQGQIQRIRGVRCRSASLRQVAVWHLVPALTESCQCPYRQQQRR